MSTRPGSARLPVALGLGLTLLAASLALSPTTAKADPGITWEGGFDEGGIPRGTLTAGGTTNPQYSQIQQYGGAGTSALVTDRRRTADSTRALKAVLPANAQREQWVSSHTWRPDELGSVNSFYGFSLFLDKDWELGQGLAGEVSGSSWFIPAEWRSGAGGSLSLVGTNVGGKPRLELRRRGTFSDGLGTDKIDAGPLVSGAWLDFVVHVRWSISSGTAVRELWRDGVLLGRKTSRNAASTGEHALWLGPAQAGSIAHSRTTFVDNVRIGTSYGEVDPSRVSTVVTAPARPAPTGSPQASVSPSPTASPTSSPSPTSTAPATTAPAPVAGSLSFVGNAETADTGQWCHEHSAVDLPAPVTSPVRDGRYAYRTEVRDGAEIYGTERSELANGPTLCGKDTYTDGEENYTAFSVHPAANFPKYSHWSLVAQFKGPRTGTPPLQVSLVNDTWEILGSGRVSPRPRWTVGTLKRGIWNDFVIHARWSPDPKVGWFEVYHQGRLVVPKTYTATMYLDSGVATPLFLSVGQYRDTAPTSGTAVLHVDAVKVGSTLAAVTPPPL